MSSVWARSSCTVYCVLRLSSAEMRFPRLDVTIAQVWVSCQIAKRFCVSAPCGCVLQAASTSAFGFRGHALAFLPGEAVIGRHALVSRGFPFLNCRRKFATSWALRTLTGHALSHEQARASLPAAQLKISNDFDPLNLSSYRLTLLTPLKLRMPRWLLKVSVPCLAQHLAVTTHQTWALWSSYTLARTGMGAC